MATTAQGLKVGQVEFGPAAMQGDFMVAFELPGPAALATPVAVALEDP